MLAAEAAYCVLEDDLQHYLDTYESTHDSVSYTHLDVYKRQVYYSRWQDVLAVFSSYVAGSEQGAPVAALTEEQVDKLREIMWAMHAVDYACLLYTSRQPVFQNMVVPRH